MPSTKTIGEQSEGLPPSSSSEQTHPHADEYYSEAWSAEYDEFEGTSDDEL